MTDHTVKVTPGKNGAKLEFSDNFNVAVPFIDRHLDEGRGGKIVIRTTEGDEVTFAQLAERVNRAGNALIDLGFGQGERVLMMVKDCPEFLYLFWGAIKAGIVPVPLNTMLRAKDYQYMIDDSGAQGVIYSPEFAAEVEPALKAASSKPAHAFPVEGGAQNLKGLIDGAAATLDPAPAKPDDDCFWLYSSGTTGSPKGAVHAQRSMAYTSQHYGVEALGMTEDDVAFSAAKLFFAYGLGNGMTFPLWIGASAVLAPDRPSPQMTFDVIEKFKPTFYFGVPTLYAAQLAEMETATPDLGSMRGCVSAGEALPPDILRRWKEKTGITILEGIGTTEMLHIFICGQDDKYKPGYTGKLVPGYTARIIDDSGQDVDQGQSGYLLVHGRSAAKYYWNKSEKTKETMLGDDWLRTGDVYTEDEEGFFQCAGRGDDMLKVGGIWCSPVEIEGKLVEHPKVMEAAVVGRADDNDLIKPEAWIILADKGDAGDALQKELLEHCKKGLAPYKYPRWINFVDELPKTATGKIQRFKLRRG